MRLLRHGLVALVSSVHLLACGAGSPAERDGDEAAGSVAQPLTTACSFATIGLPCDPDGPGGEKLECQGMCAIGLNGLVACTAVNIGTMDGIVCGTTTAVGDAACKHYCSGKTCLNQNAPAGAACRPSSKANACDGQCSGTGNCQVIGQACDYGRDEQLCTFASCDLANASSCKIKNLPKNTLCSDANACSIGKCNATGACSQNTTLGCDDGNACTDDDCDQDSGACLGTTDDNNSCSDGNACTTGEFCNNGACQAGMTPVDCNDSNACTADSCDPNIGCAHVAKSCDDADACTVDTCDAGDGSCGHAAKICNDNDSCTNDSCDSGSGCVFAQLSCDDNDACTADVCSAGLCEHVGVACDDSDPCTADACDTVSGCLHVPINGCGSGGAGGVGGTAGDGGAGGEPAGGTAAGGQAGEGATGGGPSEGGEPGAAGEANMGGTAAPGGAAAGSSVGGDTASGGTGAAGTASGGVMSTAGTTPASASDDGDRVVHESSSCGCRVAGEPTSQPAFWLVGALGLTLLRRRRGVRLGG